MGCSVGLLTGACTLAGGDACACVCAEQAQAASSPYVFVLENKISVFCNRGVNHALPSVRSLAASPGQVSPVSPGELSTTKAEGLISSLCKQSLCHLGSGIRAVSMGSPPLAACAVGSRGRLETPR